MPLNPLKTQNLELVINRHPLIVAPDTLLIDVITLMSQVAGSCILPDSNLALSGSLDDVRASCVLVMEGQKLNGLFTERDAVRLAASGMSLEGVKIASVMTQHPITLELAQFQDIFAVLNLFRQHRIRHLPILDEQSHLVGLVTPTTVRQLLQPADLLKVRLVSEIMTRQVIHSPLTATVQHLAQLMAQYQVSCVVVTELDTDNGIQPLGIVTERDIVQFQALELDFLSIQAHTVMSTPLFCLKTQHSLWDAHQEMQRRRVQRLVVTGGREELIGIVTQTSLLQALDPMQMYSVVDFLQQKVYQLESEKIELLQNRNAELEKQVEERTAKLQAAAAMIALAEERQKAEAAMRESEQYRSNAIDTSGILGDEEDIRDALEKEKELSELKSRFVSMTSHELRTPLSTILSSAEILQKYSYRLSEEKKLQHLGRIQATAKNMIQLLNDVLLIGTADAGKLDFKPTSLNLVQFCRELVEEIALSDAIVFCSEGDCTNACMDEKLLRHILSNLLSNAIKYSPNGGTIYFDLVAKQEEAIFRVQDSGIGIPIVDQAKLFDLFHRASNVGTISGTGLGLAIVKNSVDLHGGKIALVSEVGVGTTFTVTIPLLQVESRSFGSRK